MAKIRKLGEIMAAIYFSTATGHSIPGGCLVVWFNSNFNGFWLRQATQPMFPFQKW